MMFLQVRWLESLISIALVAAVLGFVCGDLRLFSSAGPLLISGLAWKVLAVCGLFALLGRRFFGAGKLPFSLNPHVAMAGFLLLLFSDYMTRRFIFYPTQLARLDLFVVGFAVLSLFLIAARRDPRDVLQFVLSPFTLCLVQISVFFVFLGYADGRLIWSDDHPSFLYRLQLLYHNFPWLPFYNVDWNAGYNAREFFPSGVLNVFALAFPFVPALANATNPQDANVFTVLVGYLFILLCPWSSFAAAWLLSKRRDVATVAGLLALAPTMSFFEWMLKYGTLGFATTTALLPLTFALAWKVALAEEPVRWRDVLLLVLVATLTLMWSLSFLALVPLAVVGLCCIRRVLAPERRRFVLGFVTLLLLLNLPWVLTFLRESRVAEFLSGSTLPGSHTRNLSYSSDSAPDGAHNSGQVALAKEASLSGIVAHAKHSHEELKSLLVKINPLLIIMCLAALGSAPRSSSRQLLLGTVTWLIVVATVGEEFKPQLELRRLVTVSSFFMVLIASPVLVELLEVALARITAPRFSERWLQRFVAAMLCGGLAMSPLTAAAAFSNQTEEKFNFAPTHLDALVNAMRKDGGSGRIFFLGFILHELGAKNYASQDGGHVAPLPVFVNKPMYASHFYHAKWSEVDPIPLAYRRRGVEGIEEFLDLVNATSVVTFRQEWVDYCRNNPRYKEVYSGGRFRLFTRTPSPQGYFLRGQGEVLAEAPRRDGFYLRPESQELVLKFRYLPRLQTSRPDLVEIFPVEAFAEEVGGGKSQMVEYVGVRLKGESVKDGPVKERQIERMPWVHIGFFPSKVEPR